MTKTPAAPPKETHRPGLLNVYEFGHAPLSKIFTEVLFETTSQRYGYASMTTRKLLSDEWTEIFGSERLTGALLNRMTVMSKCWR